MFAEICICFWQGNSAYCDAGGIFQTKPKHHVFFSGFERCFRVNWINTAENNGFGRRNIFFFVCDDRGFPADNVTCKMVKTLVFLCCFALCKH